jgi:hypothetical protein
VVCAKEVSGSKTLPSKKFFVCLFPASFHFLLLLKDRWIVGVIRNSDVVTVQEAWTKDKVCLLSAFCVKFLGGVGIYQIQKGADGQCLEGLILPSGNGQKAIPSKLNFRKLNGGWGG